MELTILYCYALALRRIVFKFDAGNWDLTY